MSKKYAKAGTIYTYPDRRPDYFADDFAVAAGFKDGLVGYLEQFMFYSTTVPYMMGWQPAHELRLDRMQRMAGDRPKSSSIQHPLSERAKQWLQAHPYESEWIVKTVLVVGAVYILYWVVARAATAIKVWFETSWFGVTVWPWISTNKWLAIGVSLFLLSLLFIRVLWSTQLTRLPERTWLVSFLGSVLLLIGSVGLIYWGVRLRAIAQMEQAALAEFEKSTTLDTADYEVRGMDIVVDDNSAMAVMLYTIASEGEKPQPWEVVIELSKTNEGWQPDSISTPISPFSVKASSCEVFIQFRYPRPELWPCFTVQYDGQFDYKFNDGRLWWYGYSDGLQTWSSGVFETLIVDEDGELNYVFPFTWQELELRDITTISLDLPQGVEIFPPQRLEQ